MFKKNILMGMLALAFVTLAAGEVRAWDVGAFDPLYGCPDGNCSYEGNVRVTGAKGPSVVAGATVQMLQIVQQGDALGFCVNPQGKLNPIGTAFKVNASAFAPINGNLCDKKGNCFVTIDQVTNIGDLPLVCSGTLCPAVCHNGSTPETTPADTGEQCLGRIYGINIDTACNNNFSFFGLVWDKVSLTFNVIDPLSTSNPVATLNATCTSPDGKVFPQTRPFNCVVTSH